MLLAVRPGLSRTRMELGVRCVSFEARPNPLDAPPMAIIDRSDDELKAMLAAGMLGERRTEVARALLKRRRLDRLQDWLSRHSWVAGLFAAVGISAFLFPNLIQK